MLSPQDIYKAVCRSDNGIDGYDIPRFYLDAAQVSRNRDLLKSIDKGTSHIYISRINLQTIWNQEGKLHWWLCETTQGQSQSTPILGVPYALITQVSVHNYLSSKVNYPRKLSIFGEIIEKGKRIKHPGVGSYDLTKSVDSDKRAVIKPVHAKR